MAEYIVPKNLKYSYEKDYSEDWEAHRNWIKEFDQWEAMLQSKVYDSVSRSIKSAQITDGYTTTLAKERADRVIAKLPEGTTEATGKADIGKAAFMDIIRQKWIYPNANAQHPFLEKLNMWQFYSSVYGYMPMFYDWNVSPTGYIGPDCWLWNPRNLIPQQGKTSIEEMDYVTALTWVSEKQLRDTLKQAKANKSSGWNEDALKMLIEFAKNDKGDQDQELDTQIARDRTPNDVRRGVKLATRYESGKDGRWCTFAPDHGCIQVRELPNPHKNGRIPFVIKYSQPLFDSFYGLGEFQRAKPLQFARDAVDNYYFTGIKNSLVPPLVANANGVLKHTLDYRPGGVILETLPNSVRTLDVQPAGLSTYQAAKSTLTGSLLAQFGSQNAALPAADSLNPSQGRTPAAIDLYSDKEATRDGAELRHMEAAIEQLIDGFNSLIVNISTETIPVNLFAEDIEDIAKAGLTDILQLFDNFMPDATGRMGELRIKPEALKGVEYRFNINPSSTTKMNKQKALMGIENLLGVIGKFQNLFKDDPRLEVDFPRIMKAYEEFSDIKGASDFIKIKDGPSQQEQQLMAQVQELQAELQEAKMGVEQHMMEMQADQQMKAAELELKAQEQQMDMEMKREEHMLDMEMQTEQHDLEMQKSAQQHEVSLLQSEQQHQSNMRRENDRAKQRNDRGQGRTD